MTQPAGEAPGAPAPPAPTAPGAPAPSTPVTPVATQGQDPNAPADIASLPPWAQKLIKDTRTEAGNYRTGKTAAEAAAAEATEQRNKVMKALGFNPDGTAVTDPEEAISRYAGRAEAAENAAWSAGAKLQIFQAAPTLGGNASALLDSVTFLDSLDDLVGVDPNSAEFRTALEAKIRAAVAENPSLTANRAAAGRSGGDFSGGSGAPGSITEEQLAQMSPTDIAKAYSEGKLKHLM